MDPFSRSLSMTVASCTARYRLSGQCFGFPQMRILLFGDYGCIGITYGFYISPASSSGKRGKALYTKASTEIPNLELFDTQGS